MATAAVKIQGVNASVCSLYLDINFDIEKALFIDLVRHCDRQGVCTDSNAHSPMWGCAEGNKRGEDLEAVLQSHQLMVRNVGMVPTFKTSRAESIIDLTITNAHANKLLNLGSEH